MPLRSLLRYLLHNEQIVQKLADSYPIRRAAQLTAYAFHRGKELGIESIEKIQESDVVNKLSQDAKQAGHKFDSIKEQFTKDIKDGFKEINDKYKKEK